MKKITFILFQDVQCITYPASEYQMACIVNLYLHVYGKIQKYMKLKVKIYLCLVSAGQKFGKFFFHICTYNILYVDITGLHLLRILFKK